MSPKRIAPKSKGIASVVASVVTIAGVVEAAYPGRIPLIGVVVSNVPVIREHGPVLLAAIGSIYAAASSPFPALRKLFPWKPERRG